jgi:hypothetical protein
MNRFAAAARQLTAADCLRLKHLLLLPLLLLMLVVH